MGAWIHDEEVAKRFGISLDGDLGFARRLGRRRRSRLFARVRVADIVSPANDVIIVRNGQ